MNNQWIRIFSISGAYIALLIGGAFSTGQEAMQFFVGFGSKGLIGLLICGFLMIYTCFSLLKAGKQNDLRTNEDVFRHFCGRYLGIFMTWYTMIMIVAVYGVMLGGVGATLEQAYGLPVILGSGLMAFCATITLLLGLNKIIEVLGIIGPIIVILTLVTAVSTVLDDSLSLKEGILLSDGLEILRASENWFFSAILYAVFSLPGLYGFLPLVGATIKSNFEVKGVALLGPFLFISAMTIVVLALMGNIQSVYNAEVPILILATKVFPVYGSIFAAVIFLGIYTTVTPLMWTICRRFADEHTLRFRLLAISLTLICWFGGNLLPFGQLINLIYPSIGYIGLILMACLIYKDVGELINKTS
ncbi:MAG: hypothetical protein CML89_03725 [Rhodobiaceae bacterium]|nr:hypothetical protein [Rhodobiaceae bacterium]|tara:strand:- start:1359 stop:2435 length:1077 start_codon:yes stop_codon:yes gene_type:complete